MYRELREAWKKEIKSTELAELPIGFYREAADYFKNLREQNRMLDKRTAKANLLRKETQNAERMISELIQARTRKILKKTSRNQEVPKELLTTEEQQIYKGLFDFDDIVGKFSRDILQGGGNLSANVEQQHHKRTTLRFLKDVPAIIGSDMKSYGPFRVEDVASLPLDNARVLAKQGLAERVEMN